MPHRRVGAAIPEMFRKMFEPPTVSDYPYEQVSLPERFRGKLEVDPGRCTGCAVCAVVCPAGVITMVDAGTRRVSGRELPVRRPVFDLSTCTSCGQCVDDCAVKALELTKAFALATPNKKDLLMAKALVITGRQAGKA